MTNEVELKLELAPEAAEALLASGLLPGAPRRLDLTSTYFDTPTLRLSRAGFTLRIRQAEGQRMQTVKAAGTVAAGLFARPEWEKPVFDDRPILDDTTPLKVMLGNNARDLAPVFELRVKRLVWDVDWEGSQIEVVLDRGEAHAGERRSGICELELELKSGDASSLFALARLISRSVALRIGVLNKAERGYRLLGPLSTHYSAEPVVLPPESTPWEAFAVVAASCMRHYRLNEAMIDQTHREALHQARVALRRLRSAFSVFKRAFEHPQFERLGSELKWLANVLGPGRDLDVIAADDLDDAARARLVARLNDEYVRVERELGSPRARTVMLDLCSLLAKDPEASADQSGVERQQARDFAIESLRRYRRKIRRGGEGLASLDHDARHQVRKDAKKLRYASDFFASLFPERKARKRAERFIRSLADLQDRLGLLTDLVTVTKALEAAGLSDLAERRGRDEARHRQLLEKAEEAHQEFSDTKPFWR